MAVALLLVTARAACAQTATYTYPTSGTSGPQYYTVPAGVTLVQVVATGASGGSLNGNSGGLGAQVQALVPVTPGELLTVILGGQGAAALASTSNAGGNNGGGAGTSGTGTMLLANGAGGGGATDLRRAVTTATDDYLSSRNALLVAGGGGGSGNDGLVSGADNLAGGAGGTPTGGAGSGSGGGAGATQSQAGGAAISNTGSAGNAGAGGGGGGGGGYYGGSGGRAASGGGGGSSWATAAATSVSYSLTAEAGNGSLSITPVTPMPVQLVRFEAQRLGAGTVALTWTTASELQNRGFEVQRSAEGTQWTALAFLPGAGSSAQARTYTYADATALTGAAYYRLRQVDLDGSATYSPTRTVAPAEQAAATGLTLYPNPATSTHLVQVSGADGAHPLRLLDAQGRLVREWPAGTSSLDPQGLPTGLYLVRVGQAAQRLVLP